MNWLLVSILSTLLIANGYVISERIEVPLLTVLSTIHPANFSIRPSLIHDYTLIQPTDNQTIKVKTHAILGKLTKQKLINNLDSKIDISMFPSGLYIAKTVDKNRSVFYTQKLIK